MNLTTNQWVKTLGNWGIIINEFGFQPESEEACNSGKSATFCPYVTIYVSAVNIYLFLSINDTCMNEYINMTWSYLL